MLARLKLCDGIMNSLYGLRGINMDDRSVEEMDYEPCKGCGARGLMIDVDIYMSNARARTRLLTFDLRHSACT